MNDLPIPLIIILGMVAVIVGPWVAIKLIGLLGFMFVHLFRFIGGMVSDLARIVGSTVTALVFVPLVILNILIGRWSASAHFGRAISTEVSAIVAALYRLVIGHPARLLGLGAAVEGLEQRVPQVMAAAPTSDKPHKGRVGVFEGYTIIGSLAGGGSGGKLYVAEPTEEKHAAFERAGHADVDQVVIKTFSLDDGSSLPQIVRENRALAAAKNMGLVLEHDLTPTRFHYVMRYVPGKPLGQVAQEIHARSGDGGLAQPDLQTLVGYVADLARALAEYHKGGLWHKDVKPDNIIVDSRSAHLVDFGLITPLRSAMTLTTHGTEYFRDPEMVRMALRGAKVHEVNGAKFDIYAAGAVLYAVIENSFPAHGALSQFSRPCPDALRWIIRRAMTDYDKRYASASEMLADLEHALASGSINTLRPAELPSVRGGANAPAPEVPVAEPVEIIDEAVVSTPPASTPRRPRHTPPAAPRTPQPVGPRRPRIRVVNWWTGQCKADVVDPAPQPVRVARAGSARVPGVHGAAFVAIASGGKPTAFGKRMAAKDQVRNARKRAAKARKNAATRMQQRRMQERYNNNLNWGTLLALLCAVGFAGGIVLALSKQQPTVSVMADAPDAPIAPEPHKAMGPAVIASDSSHDHNHIKVVSAHDFEHFDGLADATVLFLSDLLPPLREDLVKQLEAAESALSHSGARTISVLNSDDAGLDEDSVETLAEVNHRRGQLPLDSGKTSDALSDWLKNQSTIDAIAWLGADEKLYVFTPGRRDTGPVANTPRMLSEALKHDHRD